MKKLKKFYAGRKVLIAKELTKLHEVFYRGQIDEINLFKTLVKGELTVVISEKNIKDKIIDDDKIKKKAKILLKKNTLKDTVKLLFDTEKVSKKKIYDICLKLKENEKIN